MRRGGKGRGKGKDERTEVEEKELVRVLRAVVTACDEEVGADLGRGVCEPSVRLVGVHGAPVPCVCGRAGQSKERKENKSR